jgi:allantoinase
VVSDHSPSTAELKLAGDGDFQAAWGGISGLQFGLPAVWTAARARGIPLETVAGWLATAPADFAGLGDRGRIAPGTTADLVVLAPDETLDVTAGTLRYRNPVSAYVGARLTGAVRGTYLAGRRIEEGEPPRGRLLTRPS